MKLFLETMNKKLTTSQQRLVKHFLKAGVLIIAIIGISLASAAKEEAKTPVTNKHERAKQEKEAHEEHAHDEHEEKSAALTNEQIKTAGIELAQVGPADIRETLAFYGTVNANAEKVQRVVARFAGTLRTVNKKVGDSVRENEVLATVESNESLKTYPITSAISGVVAERNVNIGEQTTDKTVFVIADLSTVWVDVAIFPRDAKKIHTGQTVRITNPSSNIKAEGEIISVSPLGSSANQSLTARVLVNNMEHEWTPGLFVNADVVMAKVAVPLAIRNEAIQDHEGKPVIFVKSKEGFEPRAVKLGRTDGDVSEVIEGVKAGETYVSKNSFIIKAELGKDGAEHDH